MWPARWFRSQSERRCRVDFRRRLWLRSSASACGVRNAYEQPERLGADWWAALIGARGQLVSDCLVVCAGTATTVERLDASGEFRGGRFLPGVDLMRASLARNTAQLPLAEGEFRMAPRNTMDAIVSGCLSWQLPLSACFHAFQASRVRFAC